MTCPFCDLDLSKNRKLFDGKEVYVIFSNPRLMKGHLLVIPKRHVEKPFLLSASERTEMLDTALLFQEKLMKSFEGCDIRQHCRPFIPESMTKVDHVHFHLQPRNNEDELYKAVQIHQDKLWTEPIKEEIAEITEKLNQNI